MAKWRQTLTTRVANDEAWEPWLPNSCKIAVTLSFGVSLTFFSSNNNNTDNGETII